MKVIKKDDDFTLQDEAGNEVPSIFLTTSFHALGIVLFSKPEYGLKSIKHYDAEEGNMIAYYGERLQDAFNDYGS